MATDDERGAAARHFHDIDTAFRRGDLDALRLAVGDPDLVPNGHILDSIGTCLVYAIAHSPMAFIRTLLDIGADPSGPAADGFPPLITALDMTRGGPDAPTRADADDIVALLLARGADPNQRGLNDYTPLHMAVSQGNLLAVQRLLDAGADPELRTRIDECETPLAMAQTAGLTDIAALLARKGRPLRRRLRAGLFLLLDVPGTGELVRRQHRHRIRLRLSLENGHVLRWPAAHGAVDGSWLEDAGETLVTEVRVDRRSLINGVFYGIDGMRVGGTRRLEIAPHMGYGERGVPGIVPAGTTLRAEVTVLA